MCLVHAPDRPPLIGEIVSLLQITLATQSIGWHALTALVFKDYMSTILLTLQITRAEYYFIPLMSNHKCSSQASCSFCALCS